MSTLPHSSKPSRFRNRVRVLTAGGERLLFHCPAAKAERLCRDGVAMVPDADQGEKRYWRVLLLRTPLSPARVPPKPLTIHSYVGQRYTYREHVLQQYYLQQYVFIHPADRWAFQLSVSGCLTRSVSV